MGSAIPIAGWGFAAIDIARDGGAFEKTPLKSKKDEEKEEKKDDNEVKKSVEKDKEPDELNRVVDKFDSVVNKYSVKGKSFGFISKAKKWFGFTEVGKVPGSGNRDTVPAMLTPGEIVMSKPAVDKIGADKLLAANAAGGGTNKPSIGYKYDEDTNCFHPVKPFPSWVWDNTNYCWKAPIARTAEDNENSNDHWNEDAQAWQDSPVE